MYILYIYYIHIYMLYIIYIYILYIRSKKGRHCALPVITNPPIGPSI